MRAWKRDDGRYELVVGASMPTWRQAWILGLAEYGPGTGVPWLPAELVEKLGIEKVYGVVTGPSSCGCEPTMFRWVGETEIRAGRTIQRPCPTCDPSGRVRLGGRYCGPPILHSCDIVDVCGEPDVARAVYEAEFKSLVEG